MDRRNATMIALGRSFIAEGLPGALVEPTRDDI
jgi:hypothetical protein